MDRFDLDASQTAHVLAARAYVYAQFHAGSFSAATPGIPAEMNAAAEAVMRVELLDPGALYRALGGDTDAAEAIRYAANVAVAGVRYESRARPAGVEASLQTTSRSARRAYERELSRNPGNFQVHHLVPAEVWGVNATLTRLAVSVGWDQDGVENSMLLPGDVATQRRLGTLPLHPSPDSTLPVHRGSHRTYNAAVQAQISRELAQLGRAPHPQEARAILERVAYTKRWEIWTGDWNPRVN